MVGINPDINVDVSRLGPLLLLLGWFSYDGVFGNAFIEELKSQFYEGLTAEKSTTTYTRSTFPPISLTVNSSILYFKPEIRNLVLKVL